MSNPFEDLRQAVVVRPMNSPGPQGAAAPEMKIQYSVDGVSWHDNPVEIDRYLRFSTDDGISWGQPLLISNLAGYVVGPDSSTDGGVVVFDGTTGKVLKDAGFVPVDGPDSSTDGGVVIFDGTTGKVIKDSGETLSDVLSDVSTLQDDVGTLQDDVSTLQDEASSFSSRTWDVIIEDQKPSGTHGGTFTSGAWRTRTLNTLVYNHDSLASLSSNQFTLPAGTYCIDWDAPANSVTEHKTLLYDYTNATTVAYGTSERSGGSITVGETTRSFGTAVVTVDDSTSFEIRHRCSIDKTDRGFGQASSLGTEVYTRVRIKKIS
jgi:hypothetical protein